MKHLKTFNKLFENQDYVPVSDLETRIENNADYYGLYSEANNKYFQKVLDRVIKDFEKKLKIFDKITVMWSHAKRAGRHNAIAEYFHSSSLNSHPLFVLYEDTIQNELHGFEGYELENEIDHIIETTIIHEIGHAIVDIDNCYMFHQEHNILQFEDEEEYVEDFARDYYSYKKIPQEMFDLAKAFHERSWVGIDPDYEFNY